MSDKPFKYKIDQRIGRPDNLFTFTDGVFATITFTEAETETSERSGNPQLLLRSTVQTDEGDKIGKSSWIDLPIPDEKATDEENRAYIKKAGPHWLKFLQAVEPETFTVFSRIDKSDPDAWQYFNAAGKELDYEARRFRAAEVSDLALDRAWQAWEKTWSPVGKSCSVLPKVGNTGKLFLNFLPVGSDYDSES